METFKELAQKEKTLIDLHVGRNAFSLHLDGPTPVVSITTNKMMCVNKTSKGWI